MMKFSGENWQLFGPIATATRSRGLILPHSLVGEGKRGRHSIALRSVMVT